MNEKYESYVKIPHASTQALQTQLCGKHTETELDNDERERRLWYCLTALNIPWRVHAASTVHHIR